MANEETFEDPLAEIDPIMAQAYSVDQPESVKEETRATTTEQDYIVEKAPDPEPAQEVEEPKAYVPQSYSYDDSSSTQSEIEATEKLRTQTLTEEPPVESNISDIQFPELSQDNKGEKIEANVFSNIPVTVSVELGRSQVSLKEVFELTEGSIIELERMVGEPLDLVVNGQIIAQGEVVAIDNSYGLRVTNIVARLQT